MGAPIKGYFYREQLTIAPNPNFKNDFFEVEKVLAKKTIKKKTYLLVKYLFYPSKFNQWIPIENLKSH